MENAQYVAGGMGTFNSAFLEQRSSFQPITHLRFKNDFNEVRRYYRVNVVYFWLYFLHLRLSVYGKNIVETMTTFMKEALKENWSANGLDDETHSVYNKIKERKLFVMQSSLSLKSSLFTRDLMVRRMLGSQPSICRFYCSKFSSVLPLVLHPSIFCCPLSSTV